MSITPRAKPDVARRLVRHAANILRPIRPTWSEAMEREIDHVASGYGALVWAIGCVWAAYVERYWSRTRSAAFTAAYLITLLVVGPLSLAFLAWYTVSLGDLGVRTGALSASVRFALGLSAMGLAAAAAPGPWQWRTTAGIAFPILAFGAFLATAWIGVQVSSAIISQLWPHGWVWFCVKEAIAGTAFGASIAAVISLPFALVYRSSAFLLATLALIPEFATWTWRLSDHQTFVPHDAAFTFLGYVWPWICALVAIAICVRFCNKWLPRWPEQRRSARHG